MVSTTFMRETEIALKLPEASAAAHTVTSSEMLEITVTENGSYVVNGRALVNSERRTLRAGIERLIGERRDLPVQVRADAKATHQSVITALDVVGQLGFDEIGIATVTPPDE
jgi:biopolymer transport protein ExbD